jgi:YfiH family protein
MASPGSRRIRSRLARDLWIPLPGAERAGVAGGVSTRGGGVSPAPWATLNLSDRVGDAPRRVAENLRRLSRACRLSLTAAARLRLEHGARVCPVRLPGRQPRRGDALLTRRRLLPLAVTIADCAPLYIAAPQAGVALAHCGWRGLLAGIVPALVAALRARGAPTPAGWRAWIGPSIGPCCYDLPTAVAGRLPPTARGERLAAGRRRVDLAGGIRAALELSGLDGARIVDFGGCTACQPRLFYSYRRERGETGRMLAWIARLR